MEIAEFLLARIAEDEARAKAATLSIKWWNWDGRAGRREATVRAHEDPYIALNVTNGDAAHIAAWDPRRVLTECDAKRRIVEMVVAADDPVGTFDPDYWAGLGIAEAALQLLALPYADHPDYREEWRP